MVSYARGNNDSDVIWRRLAIQGNVGVAGIMAIDEIGTAGGSSHTPSTGSRLCSLSLLRPLAQVPT